MSAVNAAGLSMVAIGVGKIAVLTRVGFPPSVANAASGTWLAVDASGCRTHRALTVDKSQSRAVGRVAGHPLKHFGLCRAEIALSMT
jgi:hypothetical protein